ncbi:unnamed protein product [Linum tenue]|uniref:F-box domain-containing protein n=2 Tax=Linum tenue TaxID=586396 RepID=A0AAV0JQY6_9ROSI|nr:unnamed protein product [Linum tenue]
MATEGCRSSDCDRPLRELHGCSGKKRRINSDANLLISKLGDDLLVEIMIRLPNPRFACRCKLVCQRWRSVISRTRFNRRFVSHRLTMNPNDLKLMVLSFLPPMPNGVEDRDALKVLDCKNDLVLCGFWDTHSDDKMHSRSYLVCNLFTKQWNAIPLAPKKSVIYGAPVARLVCEPQASVYYSGDRFRVVCIYHQIFPTSFVRLDVFCSESGEWTKDALVRKGHHRLGIKSVVSCNGELFWKYFEYPRSGVQFVAGFNPFRFDLPPTSIDVSAFLAKPRWSIAVCQDALHVIVLENEVPPFRSSVWRLEEDHKSWRKQCEGLVNKTSKCGNYEAGGFYQPFLHPQKPEIVFFNQFDIGNDNNVILCCDLRRGELEFFTKLEEILEASHFLVFHPRVSRWFTQIPEFEKLRGMHKSGDPRTPSLNNEQFSIRLGVPAKVRRAARSTRRKLQVLVSKQQ